MILLGNIISLAAASVMVAIGLIKDKKKILLAQCGQFGLYAAANIVLGGIMGAVTNAVSVIRNLIGLKWEYGLPQKIVFSAVQLALGGFMNKEGLVGWLPVLAALSLTWFIDTKDAVILKIVFIFGQILWAIYDIHLKNYVGVAFDLFTFATNIIGIRMILKDRKGGQEDGI